MPRKTKETNEEKTVKKQIKLNEKINALIQNVLETDKKVVEADDTKKKSTSTAKTKTSQTTKASAEESKAKEKTVKSKSEKAAPEKTTKVKDKDEEKAPKKTTKKAVKVAEKEETKVTKKSTIKKTTAKAAKSSTSKNSKAKASAKAPITKSKTSTTTKAKTTVKRKSSKVASPTVVEYYDLPYKYNQTVVKVLYQNPTTLFVYWEISDSDIESYKKQYGENFFETTRPVLVVYNDTMNYSFDVDINDFANSWYFNINDSKCDYRVELIRRPVFYNEKIKTNYIYITSSNKIETPNDRILFSTNEPYTVYFKNTKNNSQRKVYLPKLLEQLNLTNKDFGFPIVRNVYDLYKSIYHIEDDQEFSVSLSNPSSRGGNPSSHSLSSRFI